MSNYQYLIVGGGMTGAAAARGIREVDPDGAIGLISAEADRPYDRPPLSKGLWKDVPVEDVFGDVETTGADLLLGRDAVSLDLRNKLVRDGTGMDHGFEKLLLATGVTPHRLPFGDNHIIYFRTLADYHRLRMIADRKERFVVIGGGFIGSEIAAALTMLGKQVTMAFPEATIGARIFPSELGNFLNNYYRKMGVELRPQTKVEGMSSRKDDYLLQFSKGDPIAADGVVAGIGADPNLGLAQTAGLRTQGGIRVDELLRTSHPDVYAAGDVATFYNPALDALIRVEHEDNATTMGRCAGRNMAGETTPYHHLPMFYSDLFDLGYEAVGELDARLTTVTEWQDPFRKGVIYYLRNDRVRGVLLWNVWDRIDAARSLIAESGPVTEDELTGRIAA